MRCVFHIKPDMIKSSNHELRKYLQESGKFGFPDPDGEGRSEKVEDHLFLGSSINPKL